MRSRPSTRRRECFVAPAYSGPRTLELDCSRCDAAHADDADEELALEQRLNATVSNDLATTGRVGGRALENLVTPGHGRGAETLIDVDGPTRAGLTYMSAFHRVTRYHLSKKLTRTLSLSRARAYIDAS
jgi:hypothetical protein